MHCKLRSVILRLIYCRTVLLLQKRCHKQKKVLLRFLANVIGGKLITNRKSYELSIGTKIDDLE